MTEKRFSINEISSNYAFHLNGIYNVYDNGEILDGFKVVDLLNNLLEENEQLKTELRGMEELLKSYRKTIEHNAELLADATKNGYLPLINERI